MQEIYYVEPKCSIKSIKDIFGIITKKKECDLVGHLDWQTQYNKEITIATWRSL